jgi:hypothetical protein
MSPRLLYLLSAEHAPSCERDRRDAYSAADRMPDHRRPRWAPIQPIELALAA